MQMPQENPTYTYADYLSWDESERIQLIDGEPVMQAAPSTAHQEVAGNLYFTLRQFLAGKPCKAYLAPLAVRLGAKEDDSDDTVLEPDVFVVCDGTKMGKSGCVGAPDLVIEVISLSTARIDRVAKFRKYQQAGVREYWIVDPETRSVHVNVLTGGMYMASVYEDGEAAPVQALPGCVVQLGEVFPREETGEG